MVKILKAFVILIGVLLLTVEQIRNYKEKRTKGTLVLSIMACAMFVSTVIMVVDFWA